MTSAGGSATVEQESPSSAERTSLNAYTFRGGDGTGQAFLETTHFVQVDNLSPHFIFPCLQRGRYDSDTCHGQDDIYWDKERFTTAWKGGE